MVVLLSELAAVKGSDPSADTLRRQSQGSVVFLPLGSGHKPSVSVETYGCLPGAATRLCSDDLSTNQRRKYTNKPLDSSSFRFCNVVKVTVSYVNETNGEGNTGLSVVLRFTHHFTQVMR